MATNWQVGDKIPDYNTGRGRWEIHKILRGGMGIVYVVYDHEFHEPFAAKTFQDEVFAKNPETADRFTEEARAWVNLDAHQNVTEARMVQTIKGKPFLFLEYVSGGDLSGRVGTPRLMEDLPQVLRFAIQFCDGMTHALSKGIKAHRDIKPQNCLITQDNTLKVTDFGLARVVAMQEGEGGMGGTPEYMPPEQWDNFEQADERADVYSFGAMLYEMLTGELPFGQRPRVSVQELKRRHKQQSPPLLVGHDSALSPVVETCLAKDPRDRFANFSVLRKGLAEIYEGLTDEPAPQPVVGAKLDARQLNNKGAALANLGRPEEALTAYDRAIEINPQDEKVCSNKGVALRNLGRYQEALTCCDRAIEINPHYAEAWSNKGGVLANLGRLQEALACYERALDINPRLAAAWNNKGVELGKLGRLKEALACSDRAIDINPRDAEAWYNKGNSLEKLGRHEEAIACYDRALDINPRYAMAWYNKGAVLAELGRLEEAIASFEEAQRLGHPRAAQGIVLCRQALGKR